MRKKEDLRIVKTKASLYRSLLELMKTKPFDEIRISEICSKAYINRSTFYDHFNDKNELFQGMLYDKKDEFKHVIEIDKKPINKKEYYESLLKSILNHIDQNKEIYSAVAKMNNSSSAKDMMINYILDITTKDKEKIFDEKTTDHTKKTALFFISGFINIIYEELKTPNKFDKEEIYKAVSVFMKD